MELLSVQPTDCAVTNPVVEPTSPNPNHLVDVKEAMGVDHTVAIDSGPAVPKVTNQNVEEAGLL